MSEQETKGVKGEKGYIGPRGDEWLNESDKRHGDIEKHLIGLMNLLGVKISNFSTKEIHDKPNTTITKRDEQIIEICKSSGHVLSLNIQGYHITDDGKLYSGWWDSMCPRNVEDTFKYDICCQWLSDNIKGAKFLYILTAFWGCDHTNYYIFEYPDGSYRKTEHCYAIT